MDVWEVSTLITLSLTLLSPFSDSVLNSLSPAWTDRSSNGDVYKGSSQTELLSRVAEAELVLSTLAAFFAIASVEWLRGEFKLLRLSAMEMVLHTEDLSPRSTKEMNEWKTARGIPNCHAGFLYQHSLQAESKTDLKTEWKLELNPPVGEPMTSIFRGLSFEDERPKYPITHEDRKKISYSPGLTNAWLEWGCLRLGWMAGSLQGSTPS